MPAPTERIHAMNTTYPITYDTLTDLIAKLAAFDDAGVDPAFDTECEELERQFAELRFATTSNA
jgi:hypothetical protein